jgi:hypothetical protein
VIKKILLAVVISATMTAPMYAQASESGIDDSVCRSVMELSRQMMKNRQVGVPVTDMMDVFVNDPSTDAKHKNLMMEIVMRAYDAPRYSTAEYQDKAADEFANSYYLDCMKSKMK